ncbi:rhodopsin, G0-coupled-like [Haliotis asinina]|uniref:rhodopsin, G0-coupled-like n=1 Tax=Haliotis asinina TaxID=109174 RepID=UPI0035326C34
MNAFACLPLEDNDTTANVTDVDSNTSFPDDEWQRLIRKYNLQPLSERGSFACGMYLLIVGIIATIGNTIVIHVMYKFKKMRNNPQNFLILNLSMADLGISVVGYPLTTASCFANRFLFGEIGCIIQGFLTFTLALCAMKTMTCLSVYRYITICRPHLKWRLDMDLTKKVIIFLWCYALFWTSPPLVGFSSYVFEPFGTSCSVNWTLKSCPGIFYTHCLIIFCYVVNISIIGFCYQRVVSKTSELTRKINSSRGLPLNINEALAVRWMTKESKVTLISMAMVVSFAVIWFPYALLSLLVIYGVKVPVEFTTLPTMFCKSSCMINPIIYSVFNSEFRMYVTRLLTRKRQVGVEMNRRQTLRKFSMDKTHEGIYIGKGAVTMLRDRNLLF